MRPPLPTIHASNTFYLSGEEVDDLETYETPKVEVVADLRELTLANTTGSALDANFSAGTLLTHITLS